MFMDSLFSPRGKHRFAVHHSPSRGKAKARAAFQAGLEALEGRELLAAQSLQLPNLVPVPSYLKDAAIVQYGTEYYLQFSAVTANTGSGAFELRHSGTWYTGADGKLYEEAIQRIYSVAGKKYTDVNLDPNRDANGVGAFDAQGQFHWFNEYELDDSNGNLISTDQQYKASCNVGDDFLYATGSPYPVYPYTYGNHKVQGLSVGWADRYSKGTNTQWIDLGSTPPQGQYMLKQIVNPDNAIREQTYTDNTASITISISGDTVSIVG